jgi:flagellar hook-associated protein 1 FlgK
MSIGSILNSARQGMRAQQTAVQIASNNIANAETVGYSRQRVDLRAALPTRFSFGTVGTGVEIAGISRSRDALLDMAYRSNSQASTNASTRSATLTEIQNVFNEPSDTGLSASLDAFWGAWSDLANDPTNTAAKSMVRQAGNNVASTLNRFASQLDQIDQFNREGMNADVNSANNIARSIADLNTQIISAETGNQTANDLRDQRDVLLDKLSDLVGGQFVEHADGAIAYYVGGRMLIDHDDVKPMTMNDNYPPTVTMPQNASPVTGIGGSLGARLEISTTDIPSTMSKLDGIAAGLITNINAIHSTGTTYNGNPPVGAAAGNFFDATTPATARAIKLDPTMTSGSAVAAAAPGNPGPGNNAVAAALTALRSTAVSLTDSTGTTSATFSDFFSETVGTVATAVKDATDQAAVQKTLASNADSRRQSVSGVSTDEELVSVIEHQHAYQAAARLVTVVDEMMATLVELGR